VRAQGSETAGWGVSPSPRRSPDSRFLAGARCPPVGASSPRDQDARGSGVPCGARVRCSCHWVPLQSPPCPRSPGVTRGCESGHREPIIRWPRWAIHDPSSVGPARIEMVVVVRREVSVRLVLCSGLAGATTPRHALRARHLTHKRRGFTAGAQPRSPVLSLAEAPRRDAQAGSSPARLGEGDDTDVLAKSAVPRAISRWQACYRTPPLRL
jgi:hypothetical protein